MNYFDTQRDALVTNTNLVLFDDGEQLKPDAMGLKDARQKLRRGVLVDDRLAGQNRGDFRMMAADDFEQQLEEERCDDVAGGRRFACLARIGDPAVAALDEVNHGALRPSASRRFR